MFYKRKVTTVNHLCHTWKACTCFIVCILISVPFLFSRLFPWQVAISNFSIKHKQHLFELGLQEEHFRTISHVITVVCPDFFICYTLLDNLVSALYFKNLNDFWWFECRNLNVVLNEVVSEVILVKPFMHNVVQWPNIL